MKSTPVDGPPSPEFFSGRGRLTFALVLVIGASLLGCGHGRAAPGDGEIASPVVRVTRVRLSPGKEIVVAGLAAARVDAVQIRMSAGGKPVTWWPEDASTPVVKGSWEVTVPLGEGGAPDGLDPDSEYAITACPQSDPSATSDPFVFVASPATG